MKTKGIKNVNKKWMKIRWMEKLMKVDKWKLVGKMKENESKHLNDQMNLKKEWKKMNEHLWNKHWFKKWIETNERKLKKTERKWMANERKMSNKERMKKMNKKKWMKEKWTKNL